MNLDALHARVALTMSELKPQRFKLTDVDATTMRLEYRSTRQGLAPMVRGLLKGLGVRFNTNIAIAHATRPDHEEFTITVLQPAV